MTERHVRRLVAAGSKLGPNEVRQLREAPRAVGLKDLMEIARIGDPVERYDVVDMLAAGRAKSAGEARRIRALAAGGIVAPPKDPVEDAFNRLVDAWSRASMAAKRRFIAENFEELGLLCAEEEEERFETEKPALLAEIAAMKADAGSAGE